MEPKIGEGNQLHEPTALALGPESIASFFGRHLITLIVVEHKLDPRGGVILSKSNRWNASAFVMYAHGEWLLITAGHVVKEILDAEKRGWKVTHCLMFDIHGDETKWKHLLPLPLPINPERCYVIGDADKIDYGMIVLGPLLGASLQANGVEPIDEKGWSDVPTECDFHIMMGTPGECVNYENDKDGVPLSVAISAALISIDRIADPGIDPPTAHQRFFGKIDSRAQGETGVLDIRGMSGCPIFGFQKQDDGQLKYWPVAVQSGWYESRGVIVAEFFPSFAAIIEKSIRELGPLSG